MCLWGLNDLRDGEMAVLMSNRGFRVKKKNPKNSLDEVKTSFFLLEYENEKKKRLKHTFII